MGKETSYTSHFPHRVNELMGNNYIILNVTFQDKACLKRRHDVWKNKFQFINQDLDTLINDIT